MEIAARMLFFGLTVLIVAASTKAYEVNRSISGMCPINCSCNFSSPVQSLVVDCPARQDADQLSEQLDSLLSSNLTYGRLTSLSIVNSRLTHVPRSVCRLTTLTQLHLDDNRLTRLPGNCFTNLTALTELTAARNNVTELQDGLFDGLRKLWWLVLAKNRIQSIGLRVFNTSAMLDSLLYIDLTKNNLRSLEPWPYVVGMNAMNGDNRHRAAIHFRGNNISAFTNKMGLKTKCDNTTLHLNLWLDHNPIKHLTDIFRGWNVSMTTYLCLNRHTKAISSTHYFFEHDYFDCDCTDFDIYRLEFTKGGKLLDDVYCQRPESLRYKRVVSVPLDQFICELTEHCPFGCRCVHRPANATLHVYCSNSNLTALPRRLPKLPKSFTKYKLDFSNNRLLRRLEHRAYFAKTSIVDVSNCGIHEILADIWKDLAIMKRVFIDGNSLTSLPSAVANGSLTASVRMSRNPWECACENRWISTWLRSVNSNVVDIDSVNCGSPARLRGQNIIKMRSELFCHDPVAEERSRVLVSSMLPVACVLVVVLSGSIVVYRLRVRLYTRWKFHPFDRDECLGEQMNYDVFLSASSEDNLPQVNGIREHLESRGYRVCYAPRDFQAGRTIDDNICHAVVRSKRTVCFLSRNFTESPYCLREFDMALHHNVVVKRKKRLIVLMALDSPTDLYANDASDTASLRQYLSQYTYIDYTADNWVDKLLYALPVRGMDQRQEHPELERVESEVDDDALLL